MNSDRDIRDRVAEELLKIGPDYISIAHLTGFRPRQVRVWLTGEAAPNSYSLARFHELGMDVIYILSGKRLWDKVNYWMDTALADIPRDCVTCAYDSDCFHDQCMDVCSECMRAVQCRTCYNYSNWRWRGFSNGGDTQCTT